MTYLEILVVAVGGFLGAVTRYLLSMRMNDSERIPVGTLVVNLVGSFLIGCVFGLELSRLWTFFLASGLAGALTTFSTLNKELIGLWRIHKRRAAIVYIVVSYCGGILLAVIGYYVSLTI